MTETLLINAIVLAVVLESDLGPHRRVTWFRVLRPFVSALVIVPFFVQGAATSGAGLALELGLLALGGLLGWLSVTQMRVYASPQTGRPVTSAGWPYALIWLLVGVARVLFAYGSSHWFEESLGSWLAEHDVSSGAVTDSLLFMALAMVIVRAGVMAVRAHRLPNPATPGRSDLARDAEASLHTVAP